MTCANFALLRRLYDELNQPGSSCPVCYNDIGPGHERDCLFAEVGVHLDGDSAVAFVAPPDEPGGDLSA